MLYGFNVTYLAGEQEFQPWGACTDRSLWIHHFQKDADLMKRRCVAVCVLVFIALQQLQKTVLPANTTICAACGHNRHCHHTTVPATTASCCRCVWLCVCVCVCVCLCVCVCVCATASIVMVAPLFLDSLRMRAHLCPQVCTGSRWQVNLR
jgi:hypothetical protein